MKKFLLFIVSIILFSSTKPFAQTSCEWQQGDLVTYPQEDWGTTGTNAAGILIANFESVYPSLLEVGIPQPIGPSIILSGASFVMNLLPTSGISGHLLTSETNSTSTTSGTFGGDVIALQLNVNFSDSGFLAGAEAIPFGDLALANLNTFPFELPLLNGLTVRQFLANANTLLGGGTGTYSINEIAGITDLLTNAFDDGTPSQFAQDHLLNPNCNNCPTTNPLTVTTAPNTQVVLPIVYSDADYDLLSFNITQNPTNGTLSIDGDGAVFYTPEEGFTGSDFFLYAVSDSSCTVDDSAFIVVECPTLQLGDYETRTQLQFNATTDWYLDFPVVYGNFGSVEVGIPGSSGYSIRFSSGARINDYLIQSDPIGPLDTDLDDPTSSSSGQFGAEVIALTLNIDYSDSGITPNVGGVPFGDLILHDLVTLPELNGMSIRDVLAISNTLLGGGTSIVPLSTDLNALLVDLNVSFGFVSLPQFVTNHLSIPCDTSGPNNCPVAVSGYDTVQSGFSSSTLLSTLVTDPDGDQLFIPSITASNGEAVISFGYIIYQPDAGFTGNDTVVITVNDGTCEVTDTIFVTVLNNCPVTNPYSITTNQPFNLELLSTDADGDALVHTIVQQAANGFGEMEDATLLFYNPDSGFVGSDFLVYSVSDGICAVNDTVFITISSPSCEWQQGDLVTYPQEDWGTSGTSAYGILLTNYTTVYPTSIVEVGIPQPVGPSILLTGSSFVVALLPTFGASGPLLTNETNLSSTNSGLFGGDVLALQLNVDFSDAEYLNGNTGIPFGDLVLGNLDATPLDLPLLNGLTVRQFLANANTLLGGGTGTYSINEIAGITDLLTNAFDDGTPSQFAQDHLLNPSCNTCPVTNPYSISTNQAFNLELLSTDADGDTLVHTITQQAAHGTGEMEDATLLFYNPDSGFVGSDFLVYSVSDGTCDVQDTVFITVECPNHVWQQGEMTTFEQLDWGTFATPAGALLGDYFWSLYAGNFAVGGNFKIFLTIADDVYEYLPDAASAGVLTGNVTNPVTTSAGQLGGEVTALQLNVDYSDAQLLNNAYPLGGLIFHDTGLEALDGLSVRQVLAILNVQLGGGSSPFNLAEATGIASAINSAFTDGTPNQFALDNLTIPCINECPITQSLHVTTGVDSLVNFLLEATDPDGDALMFSTNQPPAHGFQLVNNDGSAAYDPFQNYVGQDFFTFVVNDGFCFATDTVFINVGAVPNNCPVTNPYSITTNEAFNLELLSTDADGDALVHTIVQQATNGIGEMEDATLLFYNPDSGFVGSDFLVYTVSDGTCDVQDTVFITIEGAQNTCPVISNVNISTPANGNTPVTFQLTADFVDQSVLAFAVGSAQHGTATVQPDGSGTYLPAFGFSGNDFFIYEVHVNEAAYGCEFVSDTVFVTVECGDITEWPNDVMLTYGQNDWGDVTSAGGDLLASEFGLMYNAPLVIGGASTVTVTSANAAFNFLPASGTPAALSGNETDPVASSSGQLAGELLALQLNVDFSDFNRIDGVVPFGDLVFRQIPADLQLNNKTVREFLAIAKAVLGGSSTAYTPSDAASIANDLNNAFVNGVPSQFAQDHLMFECSEPVTCPDTTAWQTNEIITYNEFSWGYANNPAGVLLANNFNWLFSGAFLIGDPSFLIGTAHVVFTDANHLIDFLPVQIGFPSYLTEINQNPDHTSAGEFAAKVAVLKLNVDFSDAGLLGIGATPFGDLYICFTPNAALNGMTIRQLLDTANNVLGGNTSSQFSPLVLTSMLFDLNNSFLNGTATQFAEDYLSVCPCAVNECPVAVSGYDTIQAGSGSSVPFPTLVTDPDGDPLFISAITASHGAAIMSFNFILYEPEAGFTGNDTVVITVNDGTCEVTDTIFVTVEPALNTCPVTNPLTLSTPFNTPIDFQLEATDADNDPLVFDYNVYPSHGDISISSNGLVTYTPDADFSGEDYFTFFVGDGGCEVEDTVYITVEPAPNECPVAVASSITIPVGTSVNIALEASDADNDSLSYSITQQPLHGTVTVIDSALVTYTANAGYVGTDQVTFAVSDGVCSSEAVVTITMVVCPHSQGYWKNHSSAWNTAWTPMSLGTVSYTKQQLINLLNKPVGNGKKADASLILAKQLIAALLNIANGVVPSQEVLDCIAAAQAAIGSSTIPMNVSPNSALGQQMVSIADCLDQFNNGLLTDGCNDENNLRVDNESNYESAGDVYFDAAAPNPFTTTTIIRYYIPNESHVSIAVYNYLGQYVTTLVDGVKSAGSQAVSFDGATLASGVYTVRLQSGEFTATQKLVLMK